LTALAKTENFNGIDIDFESMSSQTKPYFSLFIQGLAQRLHPLGKTLTCTVVPRTPPDMLYDKPVTINYAEDYTVLNKYCDEVRVMAYDQELYVQGMNDTKGNGNLYAPVADPVWVEAVINEVLKSVNPRKVMLGIPTYGYEYQVSWSQGMLRYERVRSFTFMEAMDRADSLGVEPQRDNAGELSFIYASSTHINVTASHISTVTSAMPLALSSSQIVGKTDPNASTTFFVSFPDSQSAADEIALAKKYNLRGAMIFKADGQLDPALWDLMK
jgi:spore germination protein YaaH